MLKNRNWSIGKRISALALFFVSCLAIVGTAGIVNSYSLSDNLNAALDVSLPAVQYMTLVDMMHDGIRANVYHSVISSGTKDASLLKSIQDEANEFAGAMRSNLKKIDALPLDKSVKDAIFSSNSNIEKYIESAAKITKIALEGQVEKSMELLPEFQEQFEKLEKDLDKLGNLVREAAQHQGQASVEAAHNARVVSFAVLFLGIFLGAATALVIGKRIRDELVGLVNSIDAESKMITTASKELNETADGLTESAVKQASSLQQTASSLDEIVSMVKKTEENSTSLDVTARQNLTSSTTGEQNMIEMLAAIEEIDGSNTKIVNQIEMSNKKLSDIVKLITEIGNKTKVINEIVFQTKLLSFNASVEAARAGEHGKGFAVVAEEVGNLAQMSGNSAKEITDMLDAGIQTVNRIVSETQKGISSAVAEGKEKLNFGKSVSNKCKQSLVEIVGQSNEVTRLISEISTAIQEQNQGIQEISSALNQLDQNGHEITKNAQKTTNASSALLNGATRLSNVVENLQNLSSGDSSSKDVEKNKSFISVQSGTSDKSEVVTEFNKAA